MERVYQNHLEEAPPAAWIYQYEYPRYYNFWIEPLNNIGNVNYDGMYHECRLGLHGPIPVLQHPGGYTTNPYQSCTHGSQFNYIQQPIFRGNWIGYPDFVPIANSSYHRGGLAAENFRIQLILAGTVDSPDTSSVSSLLFGSGADRYAMSQSIRHTKRIDSHTNGYYSYAAPMNGRDWSRIDDGITQSACIEPNWSQSWGFPKSHDYFQPLFPTPDERFFCQNPNGVARYINGSPYRYFEGSIAAPESFGRYQAVWPVKNKHGFRNMGLSYPPGGRISSQRSSTRGQYGYGKRVRTKAINSSKMWGLRSTGSSKQSDGQGKTQLKKSSQHSRDPAPPSISVNTKASAPRQVWKKKTIVEAQSQPSASQPKKSGEHSTPIYHITWEGLDEPCELVGELCQLCKEDVSYAPIENEFEYCDVLLDETCKLPEVAVLPCGHAFHSQCLQLITPDKLSTDPPCLLCSTCNY